MTSILPPNATRLERALERAGAIALGFDVPIADLWSPDRCPKPLLPWLAWALSVDVWDPSWPEEERRDVIRNSVEVHRRKGTVGSVRRQLAAAGYGDAEVIEQFGVQKFDRSIARDGTTLRVRGDHWAEYRIVLSRPITIEQAAQVRAILALVTPARCHLKLLDFRTARHLYNRKLSRDGTNTRGVV